MKSMLMLRLTIDDNVFRKNNEELDCQVKEMKHSWQIEKQNYDL